jgi:hypothetical protein
VYFGFGTQWTFRPRPSLYVHHTLTAKAWLSGRTYVTAAEIERQYMANSLARAHRPFSSTGSGRELRHAFEQLQSNYFRSLGVPEKDIPSEIAGSLRRAFIDWVRIGERYYAYWPPVPAALMVLWHYWYGFGMVVAAWRRRLFACVLMLAGPPAWPMLTPARVCVDAFYGWALATCTRPPSARSGSSPS